MAKRRTKHCVYESKYAPGTWLNIGQYLAEIMCERLASQHGVSLPLNFWDDDLWKKNYKSQIFHANKLLKVFSGQAILNAIRRPEAAKVYSLGATFILNKLIKEEEFKLKNRQILQPQQTYNIASLDEKPRAPLSKKSIRDLDE